MLRILLAAAVLLGIAYFFLRSGEGDKPLAQQKEAMKKAEQVQQTVDKQVAELRKQVEKQSGGNSDDDSNPPR